MKIAIYYGGRGLIDDPALYVINKMQEVLEELHVTVERYHLYELKNTITKLPKTLKEVDGIILATTIEWFGIGGYMQQFLDACWLYGDKEKIASIYMCPVVMSTTYGEREGKLNLENAWEILGGKPCSGLCGYIADIADLEGNEEYNSIIEKKTENIYRTVNQKMASFPASNQAVKQLVSSTRNTDLTPQETEQLSQYAADDSYVKRKKEDIQELTSLFRDLMGTEEQENTEDEYCRELQSHFVPQAGFKAVYKLQLEEKKKPLIIEVNGTEIRVYYGNVNSADVEIQIGRSAVDDIIHGRMTFQRAFMGGLMKMKGDFKVLRTLDQIFQFMDQKL